MKRLLVTGASGFLGWNICRIGRKKWDVWAIGHSRGAGIEGVVNEQADLTDPDAVRDLFRRARPQAVIHAAAMSRPNDCEVHPQESRRINVDATLLIAELCAAEDIPLAFTSTDLVFDGLNAPYDEEDPTSPISLYGRQKVEAEAGILQRYPRAAVCRMPLMFGEAPEGSESFIQPMLKAMRAGDESTLFLDEFRTPVNAATATAGLFLALDKAQGILHLSGAERVSRVEFGRLTIEAFDLQKAQVRECLRSDIAMAAPRPPDVSMSIDRARRIGYNPPPLKDQLSALVGRI